jgi:hypothetical protein
MFARVAVSLLLLSCSKPTAPNPDTPETPGYGKGTYEPPVDERPLDVTSEPLFVGTLIKNEELNIMHPSSYCVEGQLAKGATYRLGRLNVFGIDQELGNLLGPGPIAIYGSKGKGLDRKLEFKGPCPIDYEPIHVQMRSDWLSPEGGIRPTRAHLASLNFIEGKDAQLVSMGGVLLSDEKEVVLRLRNPFNMPLDGLDVQVHYEGGPRKVMPKFVDQVLKLKPGESTDLVLPRFHPDEEQNTKAGYGLHSFELQGTLGKAELAIEIFLPHSNKTHLETEMP